MKTIAIVVSYANRYELCRQVVMSCIAEGADLVVVVDNGSEKESADQLRLLEQQDNAAVKVIRLPTNSGSSGGYRCGLQFALEEGSADFLWLLDDDTVPAPGSLGALINAYKKLSSEDERVVLYSYRGDSRPADREAVTKGTIKQYLPNNFCGINITKTLRRKFAGLWGFDKASDEINHPIIGVKFGPYGGMFIRPSVAQYIGLPKEAFFVYADDHEYTNRLEDIGIPQYLIYESKLQDIDISFSPGSTLFSTSIPEFRVYYAIRNHTYLSGLFIENRLFYRANKIAFLANLSVSAIPNLFRTPKHTWHRILLVLRAIRDGEKSNLGKIL